MNIFVGNLNFQTSEDQLHSIFSEFGEVKSVKIATDNFTKRPRGFGFVELADRESGEKAIERLNDTTLDGRNIVVNEARPKRTDFRERNDSRGGGESRGNFSNNRNDRNDRRY